ncbi:MAG: DUF11 domain-containing protein [Deltaproteobacteria bacterium]|nr:DUF11 domain-containing protein [Deltaproteobacteria bacterium]
MSEKRSWKPDHTSFGRALVVMVVPLMLALAPSGAAADVPAPPDDDRVERIDAGPPRPRAALPAPPLAALPVTGAGWTAQGPGPTTGGQVEGSTIQNGEVVGAVHAVVTHPTDADTIWIGAVNGGLWRTTNATAASPAWTPLIDDFPSLSIGALELDPTDAANRTLVAGIGRYSSFGSTGGALRGILRTTDGGATWTELGAVDLAGRNVSGVGPRGATILVAASSRGSIGAGMYRSTDTGASFQNISGLNGLDFGEVFDLVGDPSDPNRFYAGLPTGVFRTDDAGVNWIDVTDAAIGALVSAATNNIEFAVSPVAPNPVYAGIVNNGQLRGFFRSGDQGATWTAMDLPQVVAGAFAITNATNATPIVITSNNHGLTNNEQPQVRISGVTGNTAANGDFFVTVIDNNNFSLNGSASNGAYGGGGTWGKITGLEPRFEPGSQGATHFSIVADPGAVNLVYVGGDRQDFPNPLGAATFSGRLFRGDFAIAPGGPGTIPSPQWTSLTHVGTGANSAPHADSREMRFDANGDIIEGDDGGIYRRTDPGLTTGDWASVIGDLQVTEFHDIAYDTNSNIIIGGAQDTGTPEQTATGSTTWRSVSTADGGDVAVDDTSVAGQSMRYSSTQNLGGFRRRTCDNANNCGGATAVGLNVTSGSALQRQFVTPIELNVADQTRLVIGGANGVYESADQGDNIAQVGTTGPTVCIGGGSAGNACGVDANCPNGVCGYLVNRNAMAYGHQSNADLIYVGSNARVLVRTTAAGTMDPTPTAFPGGTVLDLVVAPSDADRLYAIDVAGVYETTDGGTTWTDVTGNLSDDGATNFRSLVYIEGAGNDLLVVGTSQGVFVSIESDFDSWLELGGIPNALVWDLDYDATDRLLVAGTLGRGAWTQLITIADLAIEKAASPDPVSPGQTLTYEITVTNNGPEAAAGVIVTDLLPPEVSYVSDTDACVEGPPGTLTCSVGNIASTQSVTFEIEVEVDPDLVQPACEPFSISNTASVVAPVLDPDPDNNAVTIETAVAFPLDHFLCYEVELQPFGSWTGVTLDDAFGQGIVDVSNLKRLCTPTDKNGEDPTAPLQPCHLTAYEIDQSPPPPIRSGVQVDNQFGVVTVDVGRPERLLVPTAKEPNAAPPPLVAPTIDHFKCHRVRGARTRVKGLTLTDQIDERGGSVIRPLRLCSPADKNGGGIIDPSVHLMCYQVRTRPRRPTFSGPFGIDNQFDGFAINLTGVRELCVPSTVTIP